MRENFFELLQLDHLQIALNDAVVLSARNSLHLQPKANVIANGEPRKQGEFLKDDAAIQPRAAHRPSLEQHFTRSLIVETREDHEQSRFATAAGTDDCDQLPFVHF